MIKKGFVYFLLTLFIYTSAGYYISFYTQQQQIRKDIKRAIKQGIPENELVQFTFNTHSEDLKKLQWKKKNEFVYNGGMYDIVRLTYNDNGTVTYFCINDTQEEKLFANLDDYISKHSAPFSKNKKGNNLNDILKKLNNYFSTEIPHSKPHTAIISLKHPALYSNYAFTLPDVITPPPKRA